MDSEIKRIAIDLGTKKTLNQLYSVMGIDPDVTAIVLALEHGKRVPISRAYDDTPFNEALHTIAESLDQQGIHVGNLLVGHKYVGESVHHFETLPRNVADSLDSYFHRRSSRM